MSKDIYFAKAPTRAMIKIAGKQPARNFQTDFSVPEKRSEKRYFSSSAAKRYLAKNFPWLPRENNEHITGSGFFRRVKKPPEGHKGNCWKLIK